MAEEASPAVEPNLSEQYDIGADGGTTGAISATPTHPPETTQEPTKTPTRDPETGRFQKPLWLVQKARDFGMSQEEIDETPSPELRQFIADARVAQLEARYQKDFQSAQAARPPIQQQSPQPVDLGIDESQYDPGLISLIKKQAEQIQQLNTQLQNTHRYIEGQAEQTATDRINQTFDSLEMPKVFGKGRPVEGSPELDRRRAVYDATKRQLGKDAGLEQVLARLEPTARKIFGIEQKAEPPKQAANGSRISPEQWAEGGLARATHREGSSELTGKSKAERTVAEYLRLASQKQQEQGGTESELDGFLEDGKNYRS